LGDVQIGGWDPLNVSFSTFLDLILISFTVNTSEAISSVNFCLEILRIVFFRILLFALQKLLS
jgi:hypothetical protein